VTWTQRGLVVGAYALFAGLADEDLAAAYRALESLPAIGALEMPLAEALGERAALGPPRQGLPGVVADWWDVVVTAIPTVMARLDADPRYGLASTDRLGREAALADALRAVRLARDAAQHAGRVRVPAIELHSAPRAPLANAAALERSLTQLLEADMTGVRLVLEHCDATRPGQASEKGFLDLDVELGVLGAVDDPRLGITVNWGRSAIEGRSAAAPLEHVRLTTSVGRLAGLMFSGASAHGGPWGGPWQDGHIAPRDSGGSDTWPESLLGIEEITEAVSAATGSGCYFGHKVTSGPPTTPVSERLAIARSTGEMILSNAAVA